MTVQYAPENVINRLSQTSGNPRKKREITKVIKDRVKVKSPNPVLRRS
jgi:hypothetical protein